MEYNTLENKLCGLGSMMARHKFPLEERLDMARTVHSLLRRRFPAVNAKRVFSRFFALDELNEHILQQMENWNVKE